MWATKHNLKPLFISDFHFKYTPNWTVSNFIFQKIYVPFQTCSIFFSGSATSSGFALNFHARIIVNCSRVDFIDVDRPL